VKIRLLVLTFSALCSPLLCAQAPFSGIEPLTRDFQVDVVRAQLVPLKKASFSAGVSAIVESIAVQEGDLVEAGEVLLKFDCDSIEAARKTAEAKVDSAMATLEVNRELLKLNSVGPLEVKLNEAQLSIAQGELDQALAKLKHCEVRAPFTGAITNRSIDAYQFVEESAVMLELVSRDELEVRMLMPSTALSWLKRGSTFVMYVEELEQSIAGAIVRIGGAVDPVSLTVPVFGRLNESREELLPGMSGQVQFDTRDAQ
jgi:RND family efflux transporter MFP subunit